MFLLKHVFAGAAAAARDEKAAGGAAGADRDRRLWPRRAQSV